MNFGPCLIYTNSPSYFIAIIKQTDDNENNALKKSALADESIRTHSDA